MSQYILPDCDNLSLEIVTIPSGAAESEPVATQGKALVAVLTPAGWDAANIGVKSGTRPNEMKTAYDNAGVVVQTKADVDRYIAFPLDSAVYGPFVSVTSIAAAGTGVPENQTADRSLILLFRRYLS